MAVDFYLYSSHEVAVWEPIWRALRNRGVDAQFVLEPPGVHRAMGSVPNPKRGWFDDKDGDIAPLVDDATFSLLSALLLERNLPSINRSRLSADAVITTQGIGWLLHYQNSLRIKTEYGASAFIGAYGHGPVNTGLDAVLAHGSFSACAISAHLPKDQIHTVGYPKWAPSLRDELTRADARSALGIDDALPVVAWLPTWAQNSGIDRYSAALAELAEDHLIVAKPHHNSVRFEAARLAAIDERIAVRADLHSLVSLLTAADVVVADSRSGVLAETFLADRPAVGLLPGTAGQHNGVLAGLDQVVEWSQDSEDLAPAVARALNTDRSEARAQWRRWLFADQQGRDDEVAAETIIELIFKRPDRNPSFLPLQALDELIDEAFASAPGSITDAFVHAWDRWPGHPRLLALLDEASSSLSPSDLLTCARRVRSFGLVTSCPLVAAMNDDSVDPITRVTAAALAAVELEDESASEHFQSLVELIPDDNFDAALFQLDLVPSAIPVFVHTAATTPDRCRNLAESLNRLGAEDEAATLQAYGESLVVQ